MIDNTIFENKKAAYFTLGCKLNFAETSSIGKMLSENGIRKARQGEIADLCVINTCSVTDLADKKCRQAIRRISRQNPGSFVVVTGCYAQLKPEEIAAIPEVDLVIGAQEKLNILDYIGDMHKRESGDGKVVTSKFKDIRSFQSSCSSGDRTRYFLKVQDGCDYFCSYCTIPMARGRSRNGSITDIVAQAADVARQGGKEIVLTGVNIGDFGKTTGETFIDLIKALDCVEGIERYRISSIEPELLTDEIIKFVASSKRFVPHFHIPLQSGSDEVLKLMKRHYDTSLFRHKIEMIKSIMPDCFIGVDVIVGVRGETDELFNETLEFIQSLDISQLHVFTYSERPGTMALKIDHNVDPKEKHRRSQAILEISEKKLNNFYKSQIGKISNVIFENPAKGKPMHGFTDNYIRVETAYDSSLVNISTKVKLTEYNEKKDSLLCNIID